MNPYGFNLIKQAKDCKHLVARLETGQFAELFIWSHDAEVKGRWDAWQVPTQKPAFQRLKPHRDHVVYHAVLPTGKYAHLHVWRRGHQPPHLQDAPTTEALYWRGGWALRPEYAKVEVLHHSCGVGQLPVVSLSDEEAWRHAGEAYRYWCKTAAAKGWTVEGLTLWLDWQGGGHEFGSRGSLWGIRDHVYDRSGTVRFILDTWHFHAGESCSEGHEFVVKELPFDRERLMQEPPKPVDLREPWGPAEILGAPDEVQLVRDADGGLVAEVYCQGTTEGAFVGLRERVQTIVTAPRLRKAVDFVMADIQALQDGDGRRNIRSAQDVVDRARHHLQEAVRPPLLSLHESSPGATPRGAAYLWQRLHAMAEEEQGLRLIDDRVWICDTHGNPIEALPTPNEAPGEAARLEQARGIYADWLDDPEADALAVMDRLRDILA